MDERKRPLCILQVNTADAGGGAESSAYNLFRALADAGYESWLAVGYKHSDNPHIVAIPDEAGASWRSKICFGLRRRLAPLEGRLRGAGRLRRWLRTISSPSIARELARGIEDFNFPGTYRLLNLIPHLPDIVHCHNLHGGYFDLRALPWLSQQAPVVLNLRDAWLLSGHCAHSLGCERWKSGCGGCPDLSLYPAVAKDNTAFNWQRKRDIFARSRIYLTCASQWLMDKVQDSMLGAAKYKVIPNAIDTAVFKPADKLEARAQLGLPNKAKIVLSVANLSQRNIWKDYATMRQAIDEVIRSDSKMDLLFLCVGEKAKGINIKPKHIGFVEYQKDPAQLARYYQAADVYIHAARAETFGKTITEALACGLPVVATRVGGIPEQIKDKETGFLVPPGDSLAMAAAVGQILTDPVLAAAMGHSGARDAVARFALSRQVKDFLDWYQEVIADWKMFNQPGKNGQ